MGHRLPQGPARWYLFLVSVVHCYCKRSITMGSIQHIVTFVIFGTYLVLPTSSSILDQARAVDHIVPVTFKNSLLPCACVDNNLDCSERGKTTLTPQDNCKGTVATVNLYDNAFEIFPNGFSAAILVNASRNRLTVMPRTSQMNPRIKALDLSRNAIGNPGDELRQLTSLETLYVSQSTGNLTHLRFLPDPCALRHLDVSHNSILNLEDSLGRCARLETLDISNNRLTVVPQDAFSTLTRLRNLRLGGNRVRPLSVQTFATLTDLRNLELKSMWLDSLPQGIFDSLLRLEHLIISQNNIFSFPPNLFSALVNLTFLDISWNVIHAFPDASLRRLTSLESLDLSHNELADLPDAAFTSFPRLREVILHGNHLTSVPADVFSHVRLLQTVSLSVSELTTTYITALTAIPDVWFVVGNLTSISPRAFSTLSRVKLLNLGGNSIQSLSKNAFDGLRLEFLGLTANEISSLPEEVFMPLRNLQSLHVGRNRLMTLPERVFSRLDKLMDLLLFKNQLSQLPARVFQGLRALQRLDLSDNRLTTLPQGIFSNLASLRELNLQKNRLTEIPAFDPTCSSLRLVSFEENSVSRVSETVLRSWLDSSTVEHVNVESTSSQVRPQDVQWLLSDPGLTLGSDSNARRRCNCGAVRRGKVQVRLCVSISCDSGDGNDWPAAMRAASQGGRDRS